MRGARPMARSGPRRRTPLRLVRLALVCTLPGAVVSPACTALMPRTPDVTPVDLPPVPVPGTADAARVSLLPPIPFVDGDLRLEVGYPPEGATLAVRDQNFLFGSTGSGRARLTVNGAPVEVAPNGGFLAFLPVPPDGVYRLAAERDGATVTLDHTVRIPPSPPSLPEGLAIVPGSGYPSGSAAAAPGEPIEIGFRGSPGADAWLVLSGGDRIRLVEAGALDATPDAGEALTTPGAAAPPGGGSPVNYHGVLPARAVTAADPGTSEPAVATLPPASESARFRADPGRGHGQHPSPAQPGDPLTRAVPGGHRLSAAGCALELAGPGPKRHRRTLPLLLARGDPSPDHRRARQDAAGRPRPGSLRVGARRRGAAACGGDTTSRRIRRGCPVQSGARTHRRPDSSPRAPPLPGGGRGARSPPGYLRGHEPNELLPLRPDGPPRRAGGVESAVRPDLPREHLAESACLGLRDVLRFVRCGGSPDPPAAPDRSVGSAAGSPRRGGSRTRRRLPRHAGSDRAHRGRREPSHLPRASGASGGAGRRRDHDEDRRRDGRGRRPAPDGGRGRWGPPRLRAQQRLPGRRRIRGRTMGRASTTSTPRRRNSLSSSSRRCWKRLERETSGSEGRTSPSCVRAGCHPSSPSRSS